MKRQMLDQLPYIIKEPENLMKKNPAIIFLHGAGTRGTGVDKLEQNSFFGTKSLISGPKSPFVVFAPLCIRDSWFDIFEQLQEFVKMVAAHPLVDANRLYLIGNSMGGYGAWQLAMTMPEYFAALVPICGGGMSWNVGRLIHTPVWVFHGREDKCVPPEMSIFMVNALKTAGGDVRFTLLDNTPHNVWDYAYGCQELFDWLLAQENIAAPLERDPRYADARQFG